MGKFDSERVISFIPPDGEFELLSYRLEITVKPLIMVEVSVEAFSNSKIDMTVTAKSNFKAKCIANNVEILVPVPSDVQQPKLKA